MIAIHRFFWPVVGPKHDAVLIFQEQLARASGLASQFSFTRAEFDHHVGILVQHAGHPIEIFRPAHVKRYESRVRMPWRRRDYAHPATVPWTETADHRNSSRDVRSV